jgi:hypothetical protein
MLSGRIWNRLRYSIFGQLNPAVVPSTRDVAGKPMLFYAEALKCESWRDEDRDIFHVVRASKYLSDFAKSRGIELLFVLIPDKERIYEEAISAAARRGVRPSIVPDVEREFGKAGLHVVSLLPEFQTAARNGALLYWRDDTHWNPEGVRLAAKTVSPEVLRLLHAP